jgi:hypothetical protein
VEAVTETIDRLISIDLRPPGPFQGVIPRLYAAARAAVGEPLTLAAARRLRNAASPGRRVFIATGHVHPVVLPYGETDGPPGAAILARAIRLGLGAEVVLLCEPAVADVLRRACRAAGLGVGDSACNPSGQPGAPRSVSIVPFPVDGAVAVQKAHELLDRGDMAAVITIEKIGPNRVGVYHTGPGSDVSDSLAKVDLLVAEASRAGVLTVGVGDLGNEIGFGLIEETVRELVPRANECQCPCGQGTACAVPVDCLVVAGVSNWGAYGIASALGALTRRPDLIHTAEIEREMIFECCRAGAVDGLSTGPTFAVDGQSWATHGNLVDLLRALVTTAVTERKFERVDRW